MELLCIKSTSPYPPTLNCICAIKGNIYNVTKIVSPHLGMELGGQPDIWYELLETGNYLQNCTAFVLAPPIVEETVEETKKELV